MNRRRRTWIVGTLVLASALLTGCTSSSGSNSATSPGPTAMGSTPTRSGAAAASSGPPATSVVMTSTSGPGQGTVRVMGLWSGPELDSFTTVAADWERATGNRVDWVASQDLEQSLNSAVRDGRPPDIVILPNPGLLHQLADEAKLVPLDSLLDMSRITTDYPPAWRDLGTIDGRLYGIFVKASSKSIIWYNPAAFRTNGYHSPKSWDALLALADRMVSDGRTPFSVVAPAGPALGWALTDWVSQLVLAGCGPAYYDKWAAAEIAWTDGCVEKSFERFQRVVNTAGYVRGGTAGILATTDEAGSYPMYTEPPTAYLYYMASFAQAFIASHYPALEPGTGYDAFDFPSVDPRYAGSVMVGADVIAVVTDTPAARSFLTYLTGAAAQQKWVELGGYTSVNRSVPLASYPDPVAQDIARDLTTAKVVRYGAGDLMPARVQRAWWSAMVELIQHPATLTATLASMTALARAAK